MNQPLKNNTVAVIDIGTSAIRMVVAETGAKAEYRYLENLHKPIHFGKDVFTTGRISNAGMREALDILKNYKAVIDSYGIQNVKAVATSAVREAANRDNFIDRIYVTTGIDVEILEGPEENRLELIAVEHAMGGEIDLNTRSCLILEVGSGSTELILMHEGKVEVTRTISLGSMRLPEQAVAGKTEAALLQRILRRNIKEIVAYAAREHSVEEVNTFVALGGDVRFAAEHAGTRSGSLYAVIEKKIFTNFVKKLGKTQPEEMMSEYGVTYDQAETLYPALLIYLNFFNETRAESLLVPMVSIRDGILLELAQMLSKYKRTDVSKQVINSAKHLAERYHYDKAHASCVAALGLKLFDALKNDHGMGAKERLLLEVAAVLHDIGSYVAPTSHHKHSGYLVSAAEIFGLRKAEKDIVANVVRYHRKNVPQPTHVEYMSLPKADRATVSKLAAILRVADALDGPHRQLIKNFDLRYEKEIYTLWVSSDLGDISIERDTLRRKSNLFVDVFGAPIEIKQEQSAL